MADGSAERGTTSPELEARMREVGAAVMGGHQEEALRLGVPLVQDMAESGTPAQREELLAWLAAAYVDAGRVEESLELCSQALVQRPDAPSGARAAALCISGVIKIRQGQEKDGLDQLRAAIRIASDPRMPAEELLPTLSNLAAGTANVGLYQTADQLFERGQALLAVAPAPLRAYHSECWAWLHAEWAGALRQEGSDEEALVHLRLVLRLSGEMQQAAVDIFGPEHSPSSDGSDPSDALRIGADALTALACAYDGRPEEALKLLDRLPADLLPRVRNDPALAAVLARAAASWKLGDVPAAIAAARTAATMADRTRAQRWQAEAYHLLAEAGTAAGDAAVASAARERLEALLDDLAWQQRLRDVQLTGGHGVVTTE